MKTGVRVIKAISTDIVEASVHAGASGNLNPSSPAPWASCIIFQEEERCVASEDSAEQRGKTKTQKKEQDPRRRRGSSLSSTFFYFFPPSFLSLFLFLSPSSTRSVSRATGTFVFALKDVWTAAWRKILDRIFHHLFRSLFSIPSLFFLRKHESQEPRGK